MCLSLITRDWTGNGPKNRIVKGLSRISSQASLSPTANKIDKGRVCFLCRCFNRFQQGHRHSGENGILNRPASRLSKPGRIPPPGQHRSPGCLTSEDRLFKIKHGSLRLSLPASLSLTKRITAEPFSPISFPGISRYSAGEGVPNTRLICLVNDRGWSNNVFRSLSFIRSSGPFRR